MYRAVFDTTPHVMGVSVDECYADLTSLADPPAAAAALRGRIREVTGCNASIGMDQSPTSPHTRARANALLPSSSPALYLAPLARQ